MQRLSMVAKIVKVDSGTEVKSVIKQGMSVVDTCDLQYKH